jgi:hypothetical protein
MGAWTIKWEDKLNIESGKMGRQIKWRMRKDDLRNEKRIIRMGNWEAAWTFLDWDNLFRKSQNNIDQLKGTQPYISQPSIDCP